MTKTVPNKVENAFVAISLHEKRWSYRPVVWEQQLKEGQKVRQCLFLGSHNDIGGGNIDAGLSTISLHWMVARIKKACGARFDKRILSQFVIPERISIEYLRKERQDEEKRKGKTVADNAEIREQQLPEDHGERETDKDFDRIKDWKRWQGAVNSKTVDLQKALIGHLGGFLKNEGERSEDEP
ncbi:hypothetical protein F4679DRAFT_578212 [Xylaria curta]|nr:hypothetical protein F4679DRAFT_578212 [Xylaria curta]